jgi:hypothetical protein
MMKKEKRRKSEEMDFKCTIEKLIQKVFYNF